MNARTKDLRSALVLFILLGVIMAPGCATTPPVVVYMPERIISDFSDMQEHEIISWAWIRRGFSLENCHSIEIMPVVDASQDGHPPTVQRIERALNSMLETSTYQGGAIDLVVHIGVLDIQTNPGRIKQWFLDFNDFPYVELEILISDRATGLPLAKIAHFGRDHRSLDTAVDGLIKDLELFFSSAL